jgi:four helix bundle protein
VAWNWRICDLAQAVAVQFLQPAPVIAEKSGVAYVAPFVSLRGRMTVRKYHDLVAWQLAEAFKEEVFRLILSSPAAMRDFRYRSQVQEAAAAVSSDIAEGFLRYHAPEMATFLRYAQASLGEAERRLNDGVKLKYLKADDCQLAFQLCRRCAKATSNLRKSLVPFIDQNKRHRKHPT